MLLSFTLGEKPEKENIIKCLKRNMNNMKFGVNKVHVPFSGNERHTDIGQKFIIIIEEPNKNPSPT